MQEKTDKGNDNKIDGKGKEIPLPEQLRLAFTEIY